MTKQLLYSCRILTATVLLAIFFCLSKSAVLSYIFFTAVLAFFRKKVNFAQEMRRPLSVKRVIIFIPLFTLFSFLLTLIFPVTDVPIIEKTWINAFFITLLGPLYEEIFFRKLLPEAFGRISAPLASSFVFGLFHGIDRFPSAFFAGLAFYFIYKESNDIRLPFIVHAVNNIMAYVFM